jgi:hypothetical protein
MSPVCVFASFSEETVNTERYLSILHNIFSCHLVATGLPLQIQWLKCFGL